MPQDEAIIASIRRFAAHHAMSFEIAVALKAEEVATWCDHRAVGERPESEIAAVVAEAWTYASPDTQELVWQRRRFHRS